MNKEKQEQCERFYYSLPDPPKVVNGAYDPVDNVIYLPVPITEKNDFYYQTLLHEYLHAKLFHYDIRDIVDVDSGDFFTLEELISECGTAVLSNMLDIYNKDNQKIILEYLRYWKNELNNKSLLQKIFLVLKTILEEILDREITKRDIPTDVRILLGLF